MRYLVFIFLVLLTACQDSLEKNSELIACPEVRSQTCTKIYRPVCALDEQRQFKTYASNCMACATEGVVAYREGGSCEGGKIIE